MKNKFVKKKSFKLLQSGVEKDWCFAFVRLSNVCNSFQ